MARIVMKFGGTSVADVDRIRNVARHVKREVDAGHEVAVVVSAMAGKTNELVSWTREAAPMHDAREYDTVVASGEQVTSGLLAIALQTMGVHARSWQGWQIPVRTDNAHGAARIVDIDGARLIERFGQGQVAVIAGFQGVGPDNRVATLGRGGSDTSAVAIAAAVKADRCDIYTDVDGVYTTDPRIEPKARRLARISFEEMLEMASLGAKVLQVRSVELAMVHNVRTFVRSSFEDPDAPGMGDFDNPPGTLICDEEEIVEQQVVTGIAYAKDEAQISLRRVADRPGVAAGIFGPLAEAGINVDMIVQNVSEHGASTDMTFTVPSGDLDKALAVIEQRRDTLGYDAVQSEAGLVKVSVIGIGMRSHAGVAATAFRALADKGINIRAITTSEIKISILIDGPYAELAVRTLHSVYGLDKQ
ncbi:aspartate kinase [Aquibium sp. A9E412]|uniref:aspartate kinase n=1 Tax=Aquibium sp. A9E412 TaxID=2976767 RepID=UPI0025B06D71|nr:aspartate kinase [Aquibium sp. A9E412]MDN2566980.1 aspartate kinase [Aquibium sp. A9E412]